MKHAPFIELPYDADHNAPKGADNSDQYSESLVRHFLKDYTKKSAKVFDPFLGFGTTAFVAEDMKRVPYGMEADGERYEWAAGQIEHWQHIINDDSAQIGDYDFPKMDFCLTSPPFMSINDRWNPLYGGDPKYAGYEAYLNRMEFIFKQVAKIMKRGAHVVVQVDNIDGRHFTPLVRDMGDCLAASFTPAAETIVKWTGRHAPRGYSHTHCLVFKKT